MASRLAVHDEPWVERALDVGDPESRAYTDIVAQLHLGGTRDTFERARALCSAESAAERRLGADVLSQLGTPVFPFREETVPLLIRLLGDEDPSVIGAAAHGFGHITEPRAVIPLASLRRHPASSVRFGVVLGLSGQDDPVAIEALIELSADDDDEVRDWATFGLGSQVDIDTPALRDALLARARDGHIDTRAEALMGLASRRDERGIAPLQEALAADDVGTLCVDAATAYADPRLVSVLDLLRGAWPEERTRIEDALSVCSGDSVASGAATPP